MTINSNQVTSINEEETLAIGNILAMDHPAELIVYLFGELGAGKTTLVKGFCRGLGIDSPIVSPTFTLVETYNTSKGMICHIDLFRCATPFEWLETGLEETINDSMVSLIEWPEKAKGLPEPDLSIYLNDHADENKREIKIDACSDKGILMLEKVVL